MSSPESKTHQYSLEFDALKKCYLVSDGMGKPPKQISRRFGHAVIVGLLRQLGNPQSEDDIAAVSQLAAEKLFEFTKKQEK